MKCLTFFKSILVNFILYFHFWLAHLRGVVPLPGRMFWVGAVGLFSIVLHFNIKSNVQYFPYSNLAKVEYTLAIQLFKSFIDSDQNETWISLNLQQNFGQRNQNVTIIDNSTHKVERNMLINRLNTVNGKNSLCLV